MTSIGIVNDIVQSIPNIMPCCSKEQPVKISTLDSLRSAVRDAIEHERELHCMLRECRPIILNHITRLRESPEFSGATEREKEQWISVAYSLLTSLNSQLEAFNG